LQLCCFTAPAHGKFFAIAAYRCLKHKILELCRQTAVEVILQRLDGDGMPPHASQTTLLQTRRNAAQWREDQSAAFEIEGRMKRCGFDTAAINAEVYIRAQDKFMLFEDLLQRAQQRRIILLREINIRREFSKRRAEQAGREVQIR
jgi:hypothetical protein